MKKVPLTVLVHDAPQARAYLSYMKHHGYEPENLIVMVNNKCSKTSKPILRWVPSALKSNYLKKLQSHQNNYWVKDLSKKHPDLLESISNTLNKELDYPKRILNDIKTAIDFENYSSSIQYIFCDGINDKILRDAIEKCAAKYILYTGGGLLRKDLLSVANKKIIHVHPGYLPDVRGADGFLWSLMIREKIGMSSFFMDVNIDTGDLINRNEYRPITIPITEKIAPEMLYRALFSYIDPVFRSHHLIHEVLEKTNGLERVSTTHQSGNGTDFHFLQRELRNFTLDKLFIH